MSFSIYALQTKDKVTEAVNKSSGFGDSSQHDIVKEALQKLLAVIPDGAVVNVSASGHHDHNENSGNGRVEFKVEYHAG